MSGGFSVGAAVAVTAVATPSTLLDSLSLFLELEEVSGSRLDSSGNGLTFTDHGVTQQVGKVGNCGQFTQANSEYLSRASETLLQPGPDLTISAWVYLTGQSDSCESTIVAKDNFGAQRAYRLWVYYQPPEFLVTDSVSGQSVATWGLNLPAATWYHIVATYASADKKPRIIVNDGTPIVGLALTNGIKTNSTAACEIGRRGDGSILMNGRIDQVGFWKRVLTPAEITRLYNGGAGLSYAAMAA